MRCKSNPPIEQAILHTAIIRGPIDKWSKLLWDADQFRDIQVSSPDERQPLAYAAINVCVTAWSLRNWVQSVRARDMRRAGVTFDHDSFLSELFATIPEQAACEAIANTAKHARHGEGQWPGGEVQLYWTEGDEDVPPGYVLHHVNRDGDHEDLAVNRFMDLCDHWWTYLSDNAMAIGAERTPQWLHNKLTEIWGEGNVADGTPDRPLVTGS
jgi:hypothetical protein